MPKALSRLGQRGNPSFQIAIGARPVRRWNSWYDPELVTQAGEKILMDLDTWAISELRKHKLVWSSWGSAQTLGGLHTPIADSGWGIRRVNGINPKKLRLFFLSLLWRAAATSRPEFAGVQMPADDLEQLRIMLCSSDPEPISFYPSQLTQLSTVGDMHNYAPIADVKTIPSLEEGGVPRDLPFFRFYFDGLIAHTHRHASDDGFTASLGHMIVGGDKKLTFGTQTYERSMQASTVNSVVTRALRAWK